MLKIGKPYKVEGQTYYPEYNPTYDEVGTASWYGPGFHGRSTANGEKFDQHGMTAAHRTLPMPCIVRVTNLQNGRVVDLKVNDRGPFKKSRIIDLSQAAAENLGIVGTGTAQVRVQYLPVETNHMIASLMENNQLRADKETLALLALDHLTPPKVLAENSTVPVAQPPIRSRDSAGFQMFSSAMADEPESVSGSVHAAPDRGVVGTAAVPPVTSRDLAPPPMAAKSQAYVSAIVPQTPLVEEPPPTEPPPERITSPPDTVVSSVSAPGLYVQAGSFGREENARTLADRLGSLGTSSIKSVDVDGKTWYRVRVGPVGDKAEAEQIIRQMAEMEVPNAQIVHE